MYASRNLMLKGTCMKGTEASWRERRHNTFIVVYVSKILAALIFHLIAMYLFRLTDSPKCGLQMHETYW